MARLLLVAASLNVWVLLGILAAAFAVQLIAGEPPCPLCVAQRIALMMCALGPLHMLRSARDGALAARDVAAGYGITIVSALVGAAISARQVLLQHLPLAQYMLQYQLLIAFSAAVSGILATFWPNYPRRTGPPVRLPMPPRRPPAPPAASFKSPSDYNLEQSGTRIRIPRYPRNRGETSSERRMRRQSRAGAGRDHAGPSSHRQCQAPWQ